MIETLGAVERGEHGGHETRPSAQLQVRGERRTVRALARAEVANSRAALAPSTARGGRGLDAEHAAKVSPDRPPLMSSRRVTSRWRNGRAVWSKSATPCSHSSRCSVGLVPDFHVQASGARAARITRAAPPLETEVSAARRRPTCS
jgi:hypothetical protein